MLPGVVPDDDSRTPTELLRHGKLVIRKQPPVMVEWCGSVRSGRADWLCAYFASTCTDGSYRCGRCFYRFCEKHYLDHRQMLGFPPDIWDSLVGRLRRQMREVAEGKRKRFSMPRYDFFLDEVKDS